MNHETVLVTGGAGYIGAHVVSSLLSSGRNVIVIDRDQKACDELRKMFTKTGDRLSIHCQDFDNDLWIEGIFSNEKPSAVLHLAGDISVSESVRNPIKYYNNNVAKTIRLIDRMLKHGIYRFMFSSTAAVYGSPKNSTSISEQTPCKPMNAYGQSKLMIEHVLKVTSDSVPAFEYTTFRYFNVAGSHISGLIHDTNWYDKENIFPSFIKCIRNGDTGLVINGKDYDTEDGTCIRDYIHPEDVSSAHMIALDDDHFGVYNIGSGVGSSVWKVVEAFVEATQREIDVFYGPRRTGDVPVLVTDNTKFKEKTGWEPKYSLRELAASAWKAHGQ